MSSYKQKVLGVAEKPEAAKQISTILSGGNFRRREGKSKFNKIFEFDYKMHGQVVQMCITSVLGHLMELDFDPKYRSWTSCDPTILMDTSTPVIRTVPEKLSEIEQNLKVEAKNAAKLILWLDCDREGENIAFEVIDVCRSVNRSLSIENNTILRARFSEFTAAAINRAIRSLEKPNQLDSLAVDARQELDLRIGASFTRFQSMRLKKKFQGLPADVVSYGPCQFPTLGFVVKRDLLIKNFESEKFWSLNCTHDMGEEGKAQFLWRRGRLFDQLSCLIIYELCVENPVATVVRVDRKQKSKHRPIPLNTIELQKLASQKLRISSHETMKLAESLYNKGFISYPRTETNNYNQFSDDDLRRLVEEHASNPVWGDYASNLLTGGFRKPTPGRQDDKAHPPIHPLKGDCNTSDQKEKDLYELIARHFLACCSQDAIGSETKVHITIANEEFTCSGLMVESKNYLDIWKYDRWSDKSIPLFRQGEEFIPTSLLMDESETRPPPHLSESDLISAMDSNGIGTDATVAQHIKTIQERGYAIKRGNRFEATNLGLALVQGYELIGFELSTPNLRAKMEKDMVSISAGSTTKDSVIHTSLAMYKGVFLKIVKSAHLLDKAVQQHFKPLGETNRVVLERSFCECSCGDLMDLSENSQVRFLYCKTCKEPYNLPDKCNFDSLQEKCPICNFQILNVSTQKSKNFKICPHCYNNPPDLENSETHLNGFTCFNCTFTGCPNSKKQELCVRKCPKCTSQMVIRQNKNRPNMYIGCKGYPNCKNAIWMPDCVDNIALAGEPCRNCSTRTDTVQKLRFSFKPGSNIPPGTDTEQTACVFCDRDFCETFGISLNSFSTQPESSNAGVTIHSSTRINSGYSPQANGSRVSPSSGVSTRTTMTTTVRRSPSGSAQQKTLDSMLGKRGTRPTETTATTGRVTSSFTTSFNRSTPTNQRSVASSSSGKDGVVTCTYCGEPARILTCQKQGDNQGRQFYKCGSKKEEQCDRFFQWLDDNR